LALLQEAELDVRKVPEPEQGEIRERMNRDNEWLSAVIDASATAYTDEELAERLDVDVGYLIHFREQFYRPEGGSRARTRPRPAGAAAS
jgi:hypothetical protein